MNYDVKGNMVMSYGTHVATINHDTHTVIAHGKWSMTTTRHVNEVAKELGYRVEQDDKGQAASSNVSRRTIGAQHMGTVKKDHEETADAMLGVLKMFGVLADMSSRTKEEATRAKADLLRRMPGIHMPEDWEQLSQEMRDERVDKAFGVL